MRPYANSLAQEAEFIPSRRGTVPSRARLNSGTLNLFSTRHDETAGDASSAAQRQPVGRNCSHYGGHRYHNYESHETREFPSAGIRHVRQPVRAEVPRGMRHLGDVSAAKQNIQVVNITAAYKDPTRMEPPRTSVRVLPERHLSTDVKESIAYTGAPLDRQLRGEVMAAPVGKARSSAPKRVMDYTRQESFCQAIRDHVQQRARGPTEFYVQLCRGTIGGLTTPWAPTPRSRLWSLEEEPEARVLTLGSCRAQLVALTEMPVTLFELADLLWDMSSFKENDEGPESETLGSRHVPYKDFAAAFGANSHSVRLAVKKI